LLATRMDMNFNSAEHRPFPRRTMLVVAILTIWVVATVFAFWWFQARNLQAFSAELPDQAVFFDSDRIKGELARLLERDAMPESLPGSAATLVHFWDPACPCSRFNEAHVRDLIAAYRHKGIGFVVVAHAAADVAAHAVIRRAAAAFGDQVPLVIQRASTAMVLPPSSPATAIFAADGELAYFGPYSVGAVCTTGSGAFVETVLNRLLRGDNPRQVNTLAFGCFCNWNDKV